jgi:glyoxylase-like metal-dependent hydrolase (beta-lactamase superfamily II)
MIPSALTELIVPIALPTPFPVGPVNVYLVKEDPITLVDTGPRTDEAYERLATALAGHGLKVADIRVVLVTHGHLDHLGLLGRIAEESGAQSWAHPHAAERIRSFDESNKANRAFYLSVLTELGAPPDVVERFAAEAQDLAPFGEPVAIDNVVEDGGTVGPFTAHYVPGHSSSDTLFVDHERRFAFTGDHLLKGINPNPTIRRPLSGQPRPRSLVEYLNSLRKTRSLDVDVCYPGHGDPIPDHRQVVDSVIARIENRSQRVLALLDDTPRTPYEICRALYPELDTKMLILGLSVALGHLEVLEEEGRVRREARHGVDTFTRTR